jgi:hypothetical protein
MANICKKVFFRKTGGFDVYKWCPSSNNYNKTQNNGNNKNNNYFCTATPNSQGFDFITTYSYNVIFINGEMKKLAYVACDYVV